MSASETRSSRPPLRPLREGDPVGGNRYRLLKRVGAGKFAEVWKALIYPTVPDVTLGTHVALKILRENQVNDELTSHMKYEAGLPAQIRTGVVKCLEFIMLDERPCLVMEFIDGETLADYFKRDPEREPAQALRIALQIASTLKVAHAKDIIHRDCTPKNIMLTDHLERPERVRVKIIDWGIARVINPSEPTDQESYFGPASDYLPPEGQNAKHPSFDVFIFGLVLYELLTSHLPNPRFCANTRQGFDELKSEEFAHIPRLIKELLAEALAIDPKYRPTMLQVHDRLQTAFDELQARPLRALAEERDTADKQMVRVEGKLAEQRRITAEQESRLSGLQTELAETSYHAKTLKQELENLRVTYDDTKRQLSEAATRIKNLEQRLALTAPARLAELEAELRLCNRELELAKADADRHRSDADRNRSEFERSRTEAERLRGDVERIRANLHELQQTITSLQSKCTEQESANQSLSAQNARMQERSIELQRKRRWATAGTILLSGAVAGGLGAGAMRWLQPPRLVPVMPIAANPHPPAPIPPPEPLMDAGARDQGRPEDLQPPEPKWQPLGAGLASTQELRLMDIWGDGRGGIWAVGREAAADKGIVLQSSDSGTTWRALTMPRGTSGLFRVQGIGQSIFVAGTGALYKLDGPDARPSVTTIPLGEPDEVLRGMWGPFEQHLFVVSANPGGKLFKVALSEKGSNTSVPPRRFATGNSLYGLSGDGKLLWGVGTQGTIVSLDLKTQKTHNHEQRVDAQGQIHPAAADNETLFDIEVQGDGIAACGAIHGAGVLYTSKDRGNTWRRLPLVNACYGLHGLADGSYAIVGSTGKVLFLNGPDGGVEELSIALPAAAMKWNIKSIWGSTRSNLFLVGWHGLFLVRR